MYYFLDHGISFPHPEAVKPSGILAIAGDLSPERLLLAYQYGIFPWYNYNEPIIWWCPRPRYVIFPSKIKVSKSMHSYFNQNKFQVTYNQDFEKVINMCRTTIRHGQKGTWIDDKIVQAYTNLHEMGYAVSVEVWDKNQLVGGLYGIAIGNAFFGESMFSHANNASKFGMITLARKLEKDGYKVIDCQQPNPHLEKMGGEFITGQQFQNILAENRRYFLQNEQKGITV